MVYIGNSAKGPEIGNCDYSNLPSNNSSNGKENGNYYSIYGVGFMARGA